MGDWTKTAIIAGIGRLGTAVAENLLKRRWRLAVSFRQGQNSEKTVRDLAARYGTDKVFAFNADLADKKDADAFINAAVEKYSAADALINIASDYPGEKDCWKRWQAGEGLKEQDWRFYGSNFMTARNPITSLLEANPKDKEFGIISFLDARTMLYVDENVLDPYQSLGGLMSVETDKIRRQGIERLGKIAPPRHINPYTLAKVDLAYLTKKLAVSLAPRIRVNAIAPGPMLAPPDRDPRQMRKITEQTLLKRWGGREPVAKTVNFLIENDYITAQIINVDAGLGLRLRHNRAGVMPK